MYSYSIQRALEKNKIEIGDRILIKKAKISYEGILMPRSEIGNPNALVIKIDSGYNVGLLYDKNTKLKKSHQKSSRALKEENEIELGKIRKELLNITFDSKKDPISLISVGGTISSRVDYKTGGVTGIMNPKEFLHNVPELQDIVNIKTIKRPFNKMSEDMNPKDWQIIAKVCEKELNKDIKGVIITHGTDFLHYTSAALSFMLKNLGKPVVLMGAQRSPDRGSSDTGFNLICSSYAAISDIAEVGICMHGTTNDDYCLFNRGTRVRKMHSSRRDAFRPINDLPLAKIFPNGKIEPINKFHTRTNSKVKADTKFEPKVAILKAYPGSDPELIDFYVENGYKGLIIEAGALGHVPTNSEISWIPHLKKAIKSGVFVGTTTQCLYGRVNSDVYSNHRILYHDINAVPLEDMLTENAYVKLGHVLGHTQNLEEIKKDMLTNYAGEISKRSLRETFLY